MKKISFCLCIILMITITAFGQKQVVIAATELPPISSEKMPGYGMMPELISAAFSAAGYNVTFKFFPYARIFGTIAGGEILAGVAIVDNFQGDSAKTVMADKPLAHSQAVFFYKKSKFPKGPEYKEVSELAKYKVAVERGAQTGFLQDAGLTLDLGDTPETCMKKLDADRVDLFSTVDIIGLQTIKALGLKQDDFGMTKGFFEIPGNLVFSKKFPKSDVIFADYVKGVDVIRKNGTLLKIIEKFYGKGAKALEVMNGATK